MRRDCPQSQGSARGLGFHQDAALLCFSAAGRGGCEDVTASGSCVAVTRTHTSQGPVLGPGDFWTDVPRRVCARPVAPLRPARPQGLHPHIWPLAAGLRAAGGRGRDDPPPSPRRSAPPRGPRPRTCSLPVRAAPEPGLWTAGPDQPGFLRGAGGAGGPWRRGFLVRPL